MSLTLRFLQAGEEDCAGGRFDDESAEVVPKKNAAAATTVAVREEVIGVLRAITNIF